MLRSRQWYNRAVPDHRLARSQGLQDLCRSREYPRSCGSPRRMLRPFCSTLRATHYLLRRVDRQDRNLKEIGTGSGSNENIFRTSGSILTKLGDQVAQTGLRICDEFHQNRWSGLEGAGKNVISDNRRPVNRFKQYLRSLRAK